MEELLVNYWWVILLGLWGIKSVFKAIKEVVESYGFSHNILKAIYSGAESNSFIVLSEIVIGASWILRGMRLDSVYDIFAAVCFVLAVWVVLVPLDYQARCKNEIDKGADEMEIYGDDDIKPEPGRVLGLIIVLIIIAKLII